MPVEFWEGGVDVWCGVGWGGMFKRGGGVIGREEGFGDVGVLELNGKGVSLMLWCMCEIPGGVERVGLRRVMSEFCCVYAKGFRWATVCWSWDCECIV